MSMSSSDSSAFHLKWEHFNSSIKNQFNDLRKSADFLDVTLVCENEEISAHKMMLSACSDVFRSILLRSKNDHPLIYMRGVDFSDLRNILDFIYTGETVVAEDDFNRVLDVAQELKIKGLAAEQLRKNTTVTGGKKEKKAENFTDMTLHDQLDDLLVPKDLHGMELDVIWENEPIKAIKHDVTTNEREETQQQAESNYTNYANYAVSLCDRESSLATSSSLASSSLSPLPSLTPTSPPPPPSLPVIKSEKTEKDSTGLLDQSSLSSLLSQQVENLLTPTTLLGKTMWECIRCGYKGKQKSAIREHVETHIEGFTHQCPTCLKSFTTRGSLRVHRIRNHSNK